MEIVVGGEKLYDFLRIKEEDRQRNINNSTSSSGGGGRHIHSGLTLSAFLSEKTGHPPPVDVAEPVGPVQPNRTLLDIISEDQTSGLGRGRGDNRGSWRQLTDKIRLRRRGAGLAGDDNNNNNRMTFTTTTRQNSIGLNSNLDSSESTQFEPSSLRTRSLATEIANGRLEHASSSLRLQLISEDNHRHENEDDSGRGGVAVEQPARMSLMALLAENDRQMGYESRAYIMDVDEKEADEEIVTGASASAAEIPVNGVEYNCCVCMVRHKGAAFIPCGHTFCRLCSRELWVQRGHCPLCNNYILEILDIF